MKLLSFITGVIVGVIGVLLYEIWGKPVEPKVEPCRITLYYDFDDTQPIKVD